MSSSSPPLTLNAVHDHLETSPNLLFPTPSSNPRKDTLETSPNVLSSPPQTILPHPSPIKPLSPASILSLQPTLNTPSVPSPIFQWNTPNITSDPIPSQSAPARSFFATLATSDHSALTHSSPSWQAARDSVLSQMITSQDLAVAATLPKARYKTGGRRGRGGRNPVVKPEGPDSVAIGLNQSYPTDGIESGRGHGRGRGRGRGGRPRLHNTGAPGRAIKRKRGQSEDEGRADKDDSDESETITPLPTQSRSGRRIFKATNFTPVVIDLEANSGTQAPLENTMRKTPGGGKRGRKPHRKPGEASVCKNCGRGHSPRGNMIVFCDGCNTPWHQYCHDPTITVEVVQIEEKEWFCGNCEVIREEKVQLEGRVSAEGMSLLEKRRYLQTLPTSHLISLLLHATTLYPKLPILSSTHPPVASSQSLVNGNSQRPEINVDAVAARGDDVYELYSESDPLPYPKAGNGVLLPPEQDDLDLLIDNDVMTFSHVWNWERSELFGGKKIDRDVRWGRERGRGRGNGLVNVGA